MLPEVGSTRMVRSGAMRPSSSACWIMASAMRSFTLQHGCISSILHTTSAKHMSVTFLSRKSGVLPITSVASRRMSGGECAVALGEAWARGWWRANRAAGCDFGAAAPCAKAALGGLCALGPIVRCIISGEESNPGNFATGFTMANVRMPAFQPCCTYI